MKASIIVSIGFCATTWASSRFNETCHNFGIDDLDGKTGRAVLMSADCKNFNGDYVKTYLDLNTCLGWGTDCEFTPYDKDFSKGCTHCANPYQYDDQFGQKFGCEVYCENKDENGKQQNFPLINLQDYIGNNNGNLYCSPDM